MNFLLYLTAGLDFTKAGESLFFFSSLSLFAFRAVSVQSRDFFKNNGYNLWKHTYSSLLFLINRGAGQCVRTCVHLMMLKWE